MSDIEKRVSAILYEGHGIPVEASTPDAHLADDLGIDSFERVLVVMSIEEEFGIAIPDEAAAEAHTVADLAALAKTTITRRETE